MKTIDKYKQKQKDYRESIEANKANISHLYMFGELNYRIYFLEAMRDFSHSAPISTDVSLLCTHYRAFDAFVACLLNERQIGTKADEAGKNARISAHKALEKVIADYRRHFAGFKANHPNEYKNQLEIAIRTLTPVWLQYRSTYVNLEGEKS